MYYFLYQTTNMVNDRFYIGIHSTDDLDDGYLGSGLNLKHAFKKYGKENFERRILEFCDSEEELFESEAIIVNEKFVARSDTYNISLGGQGVLLLYHSEKTKQKMSKTHTGLKHSEEHKKRISEGQKRYHQNGGINTFKGKKHSAKTKKRISAAQKGKPKSEETRRRMSESGKKKVFTAEHRKNLSEANKRRYRNEKK